MIYGTANTNIPNMEAIRQSGNLYAYCIGNPLMYKDPSGNFVISGFVVGVVVAGVAVVTAGAMLSSPQARQSRQEVGRTISAGAAIAKGAANEVAKDVGDTVAAIVAIAMTHKLYNDYRTIIESKKKDSDETSADNQTSKKEPDSAGKMQKEVEKGQAPRGVARVDNGHVNGRPHVHLKDGTSINDDGTIHDKKNGIPNLSNKIKQWLEKHGWKVEK